MVGFTIRRAAPDEAEAVLAVLEDGRRAIARLGIGQWQHGYPDLGAVRADIAAGECWVAVGDAAAEHAFMGACAICLGRDADYVSAEAQGVRWLTADSGAGDPPYVSVHRCAVAAGDGRRGVMGALLLSAVHLCRDAGRTGIRMDTHPGNVRMRGFLEKHGFTELGPYRMVGHPAAGDEVRIAYERLV